MKASRQTPEATFDMQQQASITQHLQLLPDFITHMAGVLTRSRPLTRPLRAFTFGRMEFPLLPMVAQR